MGQDAQAPVSGRTPRGTPAKPGLGTVIARLGLSIDLLGLLMYVAVITTYRFPLGEWGVLLCLVGLSVRGARIRIPLHLRWFLGFVVWATLSLFWTVSGDTTWTVVQDWGKLWLILLLGANAVRTTRQLQILVGFTLLCFLAYPVRGTILNYLAGITVFGRARWNGILSNPNFLAVSCFVPLSLAGATFARSRAALLRAGLLIAMGLLLTVILLTQSRQALIGLFVFAVASLWSFRRRARALVGISALAAIVLMFAPSEAWTRLAGLRHATDRDGATRVDQEGSFAQRLEIAKTALQIVSDHPVAGTGAGTYPIMNQQYRPDLGARDSHNTYLRILGEEGIVGLVLFMGMVIVVLRASFVQASSIARTRPEDATALRLAAAGILAILVSGIWGTFDNYQLFHVQLLIAYLMTKHLRTPAPRPTRATH
jgi:O-antigen ligase